MDTATEENLRKAGTIKDYWGIHYNWFTSSIKLSATEVAKNDLKIMDYFVFFPYSLTNFHFLGF